MDAKRRRGVQWAVGLVAAVAALWALATAGLAQEPAPQTEAADAVGIVAETKTSAPFPGVYQLWDSTNIDPNTYPIVGGNVIFMWDYLEPNEGQIVWDRLERWLAAQASLGKPAGLGFATYNGTCCGGNAVPQWVYNLDPNAKVVCNGNWVIPRYWNQTYLTKHANWIRAIGARYDGDPRIAWVEIGTGIYGESTPCENDFDPCLQAAGLTGDLWVQTVNSIVDVYREAFPTTPLMLQMAPFFLDNHERKAFTDHAAALGIGFKHNGLRFDGDALTNRDPLSSLYAALQHDPMFTHGHKVPVGWETYGYMLPGLQGTLWGVLTALDRHSDYIVMDKYLTQEPARYPYLEFANRYLGRSIDDTPSVWVALRETSPQYTWYPDRGNYEFWLYQVDAVPGGRTVPAWEVSSAPEGYYTRRTDQGSGNPYMYFNVDDRYLYGGQNTVEVSVTYYDSGTDRWELQYDAVDNAYKSAGVVAKQNSGQWKTKSWVLNDARFANSQTGGGAHVGSDFRLWSRDDGDDYFHMIDVERIATSNAPTIVEASFRQGVAGYGGADDTYISSWS
ncbi:MAG: hypothetical protein GX605_05090, partial [Chloroflexi bacterium]|nr:hypothetical protein [Chloroflexota bacterium]